jgi:hypothetical protein
MPQAPAGLLPRPARPLGTPDLELASYLLARRVSGRPVQPEAQALLLRANHTRQEVLALLPYGRSNVSTDLQATAHAGLHRVLAQRQVFGGLSTLGTSEHQSQLQAAALAARAGSGNCGEFANVAVHEQAGRLQPGEAVQLQRADADHAWALLQGASSPGGTRTAAVIDAWGEGPVIEPADGVFSSGAAGPLQTLHEIDAGQGAELHSAFQQSRLQQDSTRARRLDTAIARHARDDLPPTGHVYAPTPIVRQEVADAARQAISAHPSPGGLQQAAVQAVLAARPSVPEALAEAAAPTVIQMARTLREPRERPLQQAPTGPAAQPAAAASSSSSLGADSDASVDEPPRQRRRLDDGADGPRSA